MNYYYLLSSTKCFAMQIITSLMNVCALKFEMFIDISFSTTFELVSRVDKLVIIGSF